MGCEFIPSENIYVCERSVFNKVGNTVGKVGGDSVGKVKDVGSTVGNKAKDIGGKALDGVKNIAGKAFNFIKMMYEKFKMFFFIGIGLLLLLFIGPKLIK
jgi:hypothetical protein